MFYRKSYEFSIFVGDGDGDGGKERGSICKEAEVKLVGGHEKWLMEYQPIIGQTLF